MTLILLPRMRGRTEVGAHEVTSLILYTRGVGGNAPILTFPRQRGKEYLRRAFRVPNRKPLLADNDHALAALAAIHVAVIRLTPRT